MKSFFVRRLRDILIFCLAACPLGTHAGMGGTGEVLTAMQAQGARDTLRNFVRRNDVSSQLQSFGVDPGAALARVNAMTDAEAASLAGSVGNLPAGGGTFWAIGIAFLVLELIIYFWID